jgi:hypothetical protein
VTIWLDDGYDDDDEYGGICECGATALNESGLCSVCAAAPHERECPCDECEAYWARIAHESEVAAEAYRRERAR